MPGSRAVAVGVACAVAVAGVVLAVVLSSSDESTEPAGAVIWSGDFETGDASQWPTVQAERGGVRAVTSPSRQGVYAGRFVVRPGASPVPGGERAEVSTDQDLIDGEEGDEAWYGWSTRFPPNLNPLVGLGEKNIFTQFHAGPEGDPRVCTPPITFSVKTDGGAEPRIQFTARGGAYATGDPADCRRESDRRWYLGTAEVGVWRDFVLHVGWSSDPAKGFVEVWLDGEPVIRRTRMATLFEQDGYVYLKQGFYRDESPRTSVVFHDGMTVGTSYEAVAPPG
jgi:hypothetical protein